MKNNESNNLLANFNLVNLDAFEKRMYNDFIKHSSKEQALQIIINDVEGDFSQLSPGLAKIANLKTKIK